jgi:hypothetical protein
MTINKCQNVLEPILTVIGARKLRDLTAADVRQALAAMAAGYSTAAVSMGHLALKRAIRHAEANDPGRLAWAGLSIWRRMQLWLGPGASFWQVSRRWRKLGKGVP